MKTCVSTFVLLAATSLAVGSVHADVGANPTGYTSLASTPATSGGNSFSASNDVQGGGLTASAETLDNVNVTDSSTANTAADTSANTATAEKTEDEKKAEAAKKKCEAATEAASDKPGAANDKKMEEACSYIDIAAQEPQSKMPDYMMNPEREKANDSTEYSVVNATVQNPTSVDTSKLLQSADSKISGGLQYTAVEGLPVNRTNTISVDTSKQDAMYNPAQIVVGGEGSGIIRCSTCAGGKYGVNTNDGSYVTDITSARTNTIAKWNIDTETDSGFAKAYTVSDNLKKLGMTSADLQTADMFQAIGESKGYSQDVINTAISTANRESSMNTATGPDSSSAWGYGQYVGDTWLSSAQTESGSVLNRNNSINQATVLLDDTNDRYTTYSNSASLQSNYTFGQYDYVIHYAGSTSASSDRINYAVNYYNRTASTGLALAEYAANGSSTAGTYVAGTSVTGYSGSSAGAGSSVTAGLGDVSIGGVSLKSLFGITSGNAGDNTLSSVAAAFVSQLFNNSGSSSGSSSSSSGSGTTTTTVTTETVSKETKVNEVLKALQEICGSGLSTSVDANMLKINSCSSV